MAGVIISSCVSYFILQKPFDRFRSAIRTFHGLVFDILLFDFLRNYFWSNLNCIPRVSENSTLIIELQPSVAIKLVRERNRSFFQLQFNLFFSFQFFIELIEIAFQLSRIEFLKNFEALSCISSQRWIDRAPFPDRLEHLQLSSSHIRLCLTV